jgi:NADH:ubiquinone reductase (H+-translocating)
MVHFLPMTPALDQATASPFRVLVVGGGFAGITAAMKLGRHAGARLSVTLVSASPDFEYYPRLHTFVRGQNRRAPAEIPLKDLFYGQDVTIIQQAVVAVDPAAKAVTLADGTVMTGDAIILGLGSQTDFFGIDGLSELSYSLKSVGDASRLSAHIEELFADYAHVEGTERIVGLHFVVVGGGPAGVDLAGELAARTRELSRRYQIADSFVTVDIIESAPRLLPMMPEKVSRRVEERLRLLGVHVYLNRSMLKEGSWTAYFQDMTLGAKTVVWTAGVTTNAFYKSIPGLELVTRKFRVDVDDMLQAKGFENVFIVGDAANTQYAGLAQTAIHDGQFVADVILGRAGFARAAKPYKPKPVAYNIGVGPRWAVLKVGPIVIYGVLASIARHLIDFKFFKSILPMKTLLSLYRGEFIRK